jgi:hypothetical protein
MPGGFALRITNMKRWICLLLAVYVAGCAFPATKEGMVVTSYTAPKQTGERIFVKESTGGSTTLPFWTSQIPNDNFTEAVKSSLLLSKAFSGLSATWGDDWGLEIEIRNVDQPFLGLDFTVTIETKYTLYLKGEKVYQTYVRGSGTATTGDSFFGVARLRIANEKAAQANVKQFIAELSNQKLG